MIRTSTQNSTKQRGFTLIEVLLVLAISGVLIAVTVINLGRAGTDTSINTAVNQLIANLRSQQLLAMNGGNDSVGAQSDQGIFFEVDKYTLFSGTTFVLADNNNFVEEPASNLSLTTTLPSSQVVFNKGDGTVVGFVNGSNTITLKNRDNSKTITINRAGATTVN